MFNPIKGRIMKILIADDSREIRESLSYFLTTTGHLVKCCENGLIAFETATEFLPDILISDIRMPVMDGNELLAKIKSSKDLENITVILITAFGDVKNAVEAMKNGAYDYLLKPLDVKELDLILKRIRKYKELKAENSDLKENFENKIASVKEEIINIWSSIAGNQQEMEIGIFSAAIQEVYQLSKTLHERQDIPVLINWETGKCQSLEELCLPEKPLKLDTLILDIVKAAYEKKRYKKMKQLII
jgi:DNA-binding NtrC family response regulator